jgi:hypothetical protein
MQQRTLRALARLLIPALALCLAPVSASAQAIKGIRFEPDTVSGGSWFSNYGFAWGRDPVLQELQELSDKTDLTHIVITLVSAWQLSWPTPTAGQIANLNQFLQDADANGFKVILHISTPCVISNAFAQSVGDGANHVGGHNQGEVVAGRTLLWNVPPCNDETLTSKNWALAIVGGISPSLYPIVEAVTFGGHHSIAFGTESNYFYSESVFKAKAATWHSEVIGAVKAAYPSLKYGPSLYPSLWKSGDPVYELVPYVLANIPAADYYDFTVQYPKLDVLKLVTMIPPGKVIISDFKMSTGGPSRRAVVKWYLAQAEMANIKGWWIWEYRDRTGSGGIRAMNSQGGAWDEVLAGIVKADCQ